MYSGSYDAGQAPSYSSPPAPPQVSQRRANPPVTPYGAAAATTAHGGSVSGSHSFPYYSNSNINSNINTNMNSASASNGAAVPYSAAYTTPTGYTDTSSSSYAGGYYTSGTTGVNARTNGASAQDGTVNVTVNQSLTSASWSQQPGTPSNTSTPSTPTSPSTTSPSTTPSQSGLYAHNAVVVCLWFPCWWIILGGISTTVPMRTFGILALVVYGLDLANFREGVLYMVWLAVLLQSLVTMWFRILALGHSDYRYDIINLLLGSAMQAIFFVSTACWITLQFKWLAINGTDQRQTNTNTTATGNTNATGNANGSTNPSHISISLEAALHSVLPVAFAAILTESSTMGIEDAYGRDTAATVAPHIFALLLMVAMLAIGAVNSSFTHAAYAIPERVAKGHTMLLTLVPGTMHLVTFMGRLSSRFSAMDDTCDVILAITVPFLLQGLMETLHTSKLRPSIYGDIMATTTRPVSRQLLSLVVAFVASFAAQQRHLIPICHKLSYHFMGAQSSTWLLTLYWTMTTVSLLAASWLWGRISPLTGQPIFGEYHEDVVQLVLALSGLFLGKSIGLPWNMTPLPVLGILGFSLWVSTRMLRYLLIFLFVLHATGVVIFTYRFVGIEQDLSLPLPGVNLSLMRFGILVTVSSVLVGLVAGLAVRSSGGFMAPVLRRIDVAGIVLIVYSAILIVLEITLLKRQVPTKELSGVEAEEENVDESLYEPALAYLTTTVLIGVVLFMRRVRILHDRSSSIVVSLALGKSIAVFIDDVDSEGQMIPTDARGTDVLYRALVAAVLCAAMIAPRVFLEPVHMKNSSRNRRAPSSGLDLPTGASRFISAYAIVFLPLVLFTTIPYVLFPLIDALAEKFTHVSYYGVATPTTEFIGPSMSLWGLAMLAMLNRYLPDGGGDAWKKLSALVFLMGIGIFYTAPTIGMSVGAAASSPYASMSSLGSQLILRGKSRTGGWGILSAALATLLAVAGPLDLKERKHASGRKDKFLLFRTMTFSLLFGGGVAWFITVQNMSESDWLFLVLTLLASMALAFFGTVAAVLGYFVEQDNFVEVEQIAKVWLIALLAFFPIAGIPQLLRSSASHPFGAGGWLSTYLAVASISAFVFALSLSHRQGKDLRTRGLGNVACCIAWLSSIVVLYGRYGVAGLDSSFEVSTIGGVPISIFGTIALAPILLALEGETSRGRGNRAAAIASSYRPGGRTWLNFPQLSSHNRWFPSFFGTVAVFLFASLYVVLFRGSGLLSFVGSSSVRTQTDLFAGILKTDSDGTSDLAALAEKAISQSMILSTAARLSGSGFWTSTGIVGPLLHLTGVVSILPSLYLLVSYYWLGAAVVSSQVIFGLPLNVVPLLLCRGIPCLRGAAILTVAVASMQLVTRRQSEQASRMRI